MEMGGYVNWWEENFRGSGESLATANSEVKSKSLLLSGPRFLFLNLKMLALPDFKESLEGLT